VGSSPCRVKPTTIERICCFSANHVALKRNNKDWLARNQYNVSKWSDMTTRGQLFHLASAIKNQVKRVGLVQSGHNHYLIKCNLFSPWYSW